MELVRYEPWGIGQLQSEINRLFSSLGVGDSSGVNATWVPPVDIYEHDDRFQLYMDLPGVDPASVDIAAYEADPDTFVEPHAGEVLYRLRPGAAGSSGEPDGRQRAPFGLEG